jgi:proline iminopeptidase
MVGLSRRTFLRGAGALVGLGLVGGLLQAGEARSAIPDPEEAGYIAVPGGRVWYRMNGVDRFSEGKTPLLVIHGGPGFSHHYLLTADRSGQRPAGDPLRPARQRQLGPAG